MSKRSIPDWMKTNPIVEQTNNTDEVIKSEIKSNAAITEPPRRRLRSNYSFTDSNGKENTVIEKPIDYPPIVYNGKIKYYTEFHEIAESCDEIL